MADRWHNMQTITGHPSLAKRKKVAQETLDFFVPIARRIGWAQAAAALERLSKQQLDQ